MAARVWKANDEIALKSDPKNKGMVAHVYYGGQVTNNDPPMYGVYWEKLGRQNLYYYYGDDLISKNEIK